MGFFATLDNAISFCEFLGSEEFREYMHREILPEMREGCANVPFGKTSCYQAVDWADHIVDPYEPRPVGAWLMGPPSFEPRPVGIYVTMEYVPQLDPVIRFFADNRPCCPEQARNFMQGCVDNPDAFGCFGEGTYLTETVKQYLSTTPVCESQ